MPPLWESIVVDDWLRKGDSRSEELLGGKEKFWITGPDGYEYLFKFARCPDGVTVRGEDWAEWAVHQLGQLISVPTAVVAPATFIRPGDELELRSDADNPVNPRAQLVCAATGEALGYVPDWLLVDLERLRDRAESFRVFAERVSPE